MYEIEVTVHVLHLHHSVKVVVKKLLVQTEHSVQTHIYVKNVQIMTEYVDEQTEKNEFARK